MSEHGVSFGLFADYHLSFSNFDNEAQAFVEVVIGDVSLKRTTLPVSVNNLGRVYANETKWYRRMQGQRG